MAQEKRQTQMATVQFVPSGSVKRSMPTMNGACSKSMLKNGESVPVRAILRDNGGGGRGGQLPAKKIQPLPEKKSQGMKAMAKLLKKCRR